MSKLLTKRNGAVALALVVGLVVGTAGGGFAGGSGIPADKATAAGSKRVEAGPDVAVPILKARLKTSKPTDLILQLTMECSVLTKLKTSASNPSAGAAGTVKAWITIDGAIVPVESESTPPQDPPPPGLPAGPTEDAPSDAATMCNRAYQRTVADDELAPDGQDTEEDFIRTKSANGFNWLRQNTGSGEHEVIVWAMLDQRTTAGAPGDATAEVEIGNRTLIIEPTKMANDAI
ncbi:MAG TPA: hypothetical protein VGB03_06230, partial [Acidimicrobiales bacterium]